MYNVLSFEFLYFNFIFVLKRFLTWKWNERFFEQEFFSTTVKEISHFYYRSKLSNQNVNSLWIIHTSIHTLKIRVFEHESHTLCKKKRWRTKKYADMWKCVLCNVCHKHLHIMDSMLEGNPRILQAATMFQHIIDWFSLFAVHDT